MLSVSDAVVDSLWSSVLCQLHEDVKWLLLQFRQVLVLSFVESLCTVDKKWTHQDIYSEWIESSQ